MNNVTTTTDLCLGVRSRGIITVFAFIILILSPSVISLDGGDTNSTTEAPEVHTESIITSYEHEHQYHHHHHSLPHDAMGGGSGEHSIAANATTNDQESRPPIDWAQVERDFDRVLADEEVLHRWDSMEANMKSGMRTLLRSIFPKVVAMSTDAKVSGNCSAGILKWVVSLRNMKTWAMKMFDAIGKPPSGMFEGVVTMFGNYDQCLGIRVYEDDQDSDSTLEGDGSFLSTSEDESSGKPATDNTREFFRGQYCVAEFKPWLPAKPHYYGMNSRLKASQRNDDSVFSEFSKMAVFFHFISFRIDLCVPSTCTKDDIQRVTSLMANLAEFRSRVVRCETTPREWHLPFELLTLASVVLVLLLLTLLSSLQDVSILCLPWLPTRLVHIFSLPRSWSTFRSLGSATGAHLSAVQGFRVLVILWIVVAHTFIQVDYQYLRELQTLKAWASRWWAQVLTNSVYQFDCLLLLSAFTFGYHNVEHSGHKVWRYVAKRYLKILLLIAFLMVVVVALPAMLPGGPVVQDFVERQAASCKQDWWWNVFYLQNYFPNQCLSSSWIFAVELQLTLLTLPLLFLYHSFVDQKTGRLLFWLCFPLLLSLGAGYNLARVFYEQLPPTFYWTLPDKQQRADYFGQYYHRPLTHLSVYIIGFYAGVYRKLSNSKKKTLFNEPNILMFGYFLSLFTIVSFTFGFHDWITGELPNAYISALYDAAHRICLSAAFAWILFSVSDDVRDTDRVPSHFTRFLSSEYFGQLGKLSVTSYLVLPLVQSILLATQQQHLYSSWLLMAYIMLGNTVFTYLFATLLNVVLEVPGAKVFDWCLQLVEHGHRRLRCRVTPSARTHHHHSSEPPGFEQKLRENSSTNLCPTNIEIPSYTLKN